MGVSAALTTGNKIKLLFAKTNVIVIILVVLVLKYKGEILPCPEPMTEAEFPQEHNMDAMAVEKLAQGIRDFAFEKLEAFCFHS